MSLEITGTRKRIKCPECGAFIYRVKWRNSSSYDVVGFYCQPCNILYPKKGIKVRTDKLYQGLRQVN